MSEVVFERVTKRFGDVTAVDRFDLEILDGEFMVLLGPSGCGKSTALRCIAGLEDITEGTLRIGDRVVNDVEARHRDISMVFQSYALYPHLSVAKNIESPLLARKFAVDGEAEPRKLHKHERAERVAEAARILGLSELVDRKPGALSGGQRQRVALARAIVRRPKAFLFDEPLSNLDAKLRGETRLELVALHERLATTFVYVTHDQVEAMTMADRIAVIADGRLQQVGPPQAVYDRPHNLFVARFIGSPAMNTLTGVVRIVDGEPWLELGGEDRVRIGAIDPDPLADGTKAVLGVRPEHLRIERDGPAAMVVVAVEWLGHERHVVGELAGERITVREPAEGPGPAVGELVRLGADPDHVHLFDPNTTERLA
jgi:ABC-type sugar transport system ATPase subunit